MAPYAPPSVKIRNDRLHTKGCRVDRQNKNWSTLVSEPKKVLQTGFLCPPLIMTGLMQGFDNKHSRDKFFFNFRDYIAGEMRTAFVLGKLSGLKNINKDEHVDSILKSLALLNTSNIDFGRLETKEYRMERRAKNAKMGADVLPSTTPLGYTSLGTSTMKRKSSDPLREDSHETVHDNLDRGIYSLTPESRTWQQHGKSKIKIRKIGFCHLPTVATTTHKLAGFSIDLAFVDVNADFSTDLCIGQFYVWLSRPWEVRQLLGKSSLKHGTVF